MSTPAPIEPDTKDWTWVLERPCPHCGFDGAAVRREDLGRLVRRSAVGWEPVLTGPDATTRPEPRVWSPVEYACHVRDVHTLFAERIDQMLREDGARFASWDQDATATEQRYDLQDPRVVAIELVRAAEAVAAMYDTVPRDAWERRGLRSNGDAFTVESLGRYHLHDVLHHLWDVGGTEGRA